MSKFTCTKLSTAFSPLFDLNSCIDVTLREFGLNAFLKRDLLTRFKSQGIDAVVVVSNSPSGKVVLFRPEYDLDYIEEDDNFTPVIRFNSFNSEHSRYYGSGHPYETADQAIQALLENELSKNHKKYGDLLGELKRKGFRNVDLASSGVVVFFAPKPKVVKQGAIKIVSPVKFVLVAKILAYCEEIVRRSNRKL